MRSPNALYAALAALLIAASPAAPFTEHSEGAALDVPLPYDSVLAARAARPATDLPAPRAGELGLGWLAQIDPSTGRARMAFGGSLPVAAGLRDASQAESVARAFVLRHEDLLGVRLDNSHTQSVRHAAGKWAVWFQQEIDAMPVWNGTAFVLVSESGRIAAFGSEFQLEPAEQSPAAVSAEDAIASAAHALGATPRGDRPQSAERWWMPLPAGESLTLVAAWRVTFEAEEPFGKWETFVHGTSGEILGRRNLYFAEDILGGMRGLAAANPPSYGWCDGFSAYPFEHQQVQIVGGESATTNERGGFTIPAGSDRVRLDTRLQGPYCNVNVIGGTNASQRLWANPGVPLMVRWTASNSRPDERSAFYHTNRVHDFMKALDPTFIQLDYAMATNVARVDGFCPGNAWWDGHGMNFCESGDGYYNTGTMGNVISHEYGHGVTQEVYGRNAQPEPPGALHEGNSDVLANFTDRNPHIGLGFSTATGCLSGIRNSDNDLTYPGLSETNGEAHVAGQVLAGFHWVAWQELLATLPAEEADQVAFSTWHFGRDLGTPRTFPDQVLWTFFVDDDDGNLANGTPHCDAFCTAAEAKGFTCPPCGILFVHEPPPHTTDGSQGFDVVATITSPAAPLDLAASRVFYRVNGGPFGELSLAATGGPDEYSAHIPPQGSNSEVEYYFLVVDLLGHSRKSPPTAPAALYNVDVAWQIDDLESGAAGWVPEAPGDDASSGYWDLVDPVGTEAQPENDATAKGVYGFITGQCGPGESDCTTTCQLACSDVDGGTVTLFSPVYDLTAATTAVLKYSRWYSNDAADNPAQDFWDVDVSNDGGATWANVEHTVETRESWVSGRADLNALFGAPGHARLRFRASDTDGGSVVEAGVDDLRVLATFGAPAASATWAAPPAFALEPGQPNPFRAQARIEWAVPRPANVALTVYDVGGRAVRTLTSGVREAGRYRAEWDGRDASGARVAAGVYFVRLVAGSDAMTRKVTVLP